MCECWGRKSQDIIMSFLTGHHEDCKYRKPDKTIWCELVSEFLDAIELWAVDKERIPEEIVNVCAKGRIAVGRDSSLPFLKKGRTMSKNSSEQEIVEASKDRMAKETGISRKHPRFEKIWDWAWKQGHAFGISEVESYFCEAVELIKTCSDIEKRL